MILKRMHYLGVLLWINNKFVSMNMSFSFEKNFFVQQFLEDQLSIASNYADCWNKFSKFRPKGVTRMLFSIHYCGISLRW